MDTLPSPNPTRVGTLFFLKKKNAFLFACLCMLLLSACSPIPHVRKLGAKGISGQPGDCLIQSLVSLLPVSTSDFSSPVRRCFFLANLDGSLTESSELAAALCEIAAGDGDARTRSLVGAALQVYHHRRRRSVTLASWPLPSCPICWLVRSPPIVFSKKKRGTRGNKFAGYRSIAGCRRGEVVHAAAVHRPEVSI